MSKLTFPQWLQREYGIADFNLFYQKTEQRQKELEEEYHKYEKRFEK